MKKIQKKICLLGDFAVGKTSLVRRFVDGRFDDKYLSTLGVKISRKSLDRPDFKLNFIIWDLAGGDDYSSLTAGYLRGAAGALLVCDLTRAGTLDILEKYAAQLRANNPQAALVVVGNKLDLTTDRQISDEDLQQEAAVLKAPYLLSSAKTGQGVEEAFAHLADLLGR